MLSLGGYFEGMFGRIKPPAQRLELAKTLPDTVRDHLVQSDRLETMAEGSKTRLAGSYGRRTGVDDIKDVDVLVFVARRYETEPPENVLDDLAAALKDLEVDGYGEGQVKTSRKNRRSHHVEFTKDGEQAFHIDCVPVVRPADDPSAVLRIPDREWVGWDDTQPLGYHDLLTTLNQDNDRKVLKTIRMLKRIRNQQLRRAIVRPKSYWLESKVYELWNARRLSKSDTYADLMYDLLTKLRADCRLQPDRLRIYDPCSGRDLTATWEPAEYDEFVGMLDDVMGHLDPIAEEADTERAVAAWRQVFGDVFEPSDESKRREATAAAAAAGATVTTLGTVVPTASGKPGVKAPAHTFYGER